MTKLTVVLVFGLLMLLPRLSIQQQCITSSDIGQVECVLLSTYYNDYQWATCLTEQYIMRSSDQRHECRDSSATQCWYQCMLEIYDRDRGTVNEGCRCSPGTAMTLNLPPRCYSPSGVDCMWYRDCLEVRYPCEGNNGAYAIEYGEKFCKLYSDNYNDFSSESQAWIDAVRKCLQVALVPTLRPWMNKTCTDIRNDAFDSHPNCYINPDPASRAPGICDLSCADATRVFWLVSFEGGSLLHAPIETAQQMLSVMTGCFGTGLLSRCVEQAVLFITTEVPIQIKRFAVSISLQLVRSISEKLNWESNGFRWLPLPDNSFSTNRKKRQTSTTQNNLEIKVLLVDAKALNITNGTMLAPTRAPNLKQALDTFATAVKNGELSEIPLLLNNSRVILSVNSIGQCADILCNVTNITELAIAPQPSSAKIFPPLCHVVAVLIMICFILSL